MARPRRVDGAVDTREQILRAARIEYASQGVSVPLEVIAARCGIRRPSLLHHFPSKQALIAAVIDDVLLKTRARLRQAVGSGENDYAGTMRRIVGVLRELEQEEQGVGGVLLQAMLVEGSDGIVSQRMAELIDMIFATALLAGADKQRSKPELRAAIAHLVIGEIARIALASRADLLWGEGDGVDPLFESYFLSVSG